MIAAEDSAVADPIEASEWLEETLAVEAGGTLVVRTSRGTVDVRSHDADEVRVEAEARGRRADRVSFLLEQSGNDVRFEARTDGWLTGVFGSLDVRVRLWVPRRYSLVLRSSGGDVRVDGITGDMEVRTSGGDISLSRIVGRVDLSSSGGLVEVEHVDGPVRAKTSGGTFSLRDVFGDISARSSGGSFTIDGVDGSVDLRTSGGSASVVFLGDPEGEIRTSGGSVEIFVREDANAELDARASGGDVHIDEELGLERERERGQHRYSGRLGHGGPSLKLRTSGGGIRVGLL